MTSKSEFDESDCCGNGCANCVLDIKVQNKNISSSFEGKQNVLDKFTKYRLLSKVLHSPPQVNNVWELHFKSLERMGESYVLHIQPGYHLMMRQKLGPEEQQSDTFKDDKINDRGISEMKRIYLLRPYSPFWWKTDEMQFKILVNLKNQGPMSKYIRDLKDDDEVEFRGPIGSFDYKADDKGQQQLLIITQGVAIAPIVPIVETVLHNDDDLTRITHIACFQNIDRIYFREILYDFQKYWNYKNHIYLAHELCAAKECQENERCLKDCKILYGKRKYKENLYSQRLTEEELAKIIEPLKSFNLNVIVVIAGYSNFQMYFKNIMDKYNFNTYLL